MKMNVIIIRIVLIITSFIYNDIEIHITPDIVNINTNVMMIRFMLYFMKLKIIFMLDAMLIFARLTTLIT